MIFVKQLRVSSNIAVFLFGLVAFQNLSDARPRRAPTVQSSPAPVAESSSSRTPQGRRSKASPKVTFDQAAAKDIRETLARIERGEKLPHRNDGAIFHNLEHRLPRQADGYYHEYVVPSPPQRGPGPRRLILGGHGSEIFYTPDHYVTFIPVERERL